MFSYVLIKYLFSSDDGIIKKCLVASSYSESKGVCCFMELEAMSQLGCNTDGDSCLLPVGIY